MITSARSCGTGTTVAPAQQTVTMALTSVPSRARYSFWYVCVEKVVCSLQSGRDRRDDVGHCDGHVVVSAVGQGVADQRSRHRRRRRVAVGRDETGEVVRQRRVVPESVRAHDEAAAPRRTEGGDRTGAGGASAPAQRVMAWARLSASADSRSSLPALT